MKPRVSIQHILQKFCVMDLGIIQNYNNFAIWVTLKYMN